MGLSPTLIPLHFETDLDHHWDTEKIWIFPFSYYEVPWQRTAFFKGSFYGNFFLKSRLLKVFVFLNTVYDLVLFILVLLFGQILVFMVMLN